MGEFTNNKLANLKRYYKRTSPHTFFNDFVNILASSQSNTSDWLLLMKASDFVFELSWKY